MPAIDSLNEYRTSVSEASSFIATILQRHASGGYKYPAALRGFVVESAFVKIFVAWETFIEGIFMKYMMGENPDTVPLSHRYASPISRSHANDFLLGIGKKDFIEWSTPDTVKKLSGIYFGNENIINDTIGGIYQDLISLKIIRNAIAHVSSTTSSKLDRLASTIIGLPQVGIQPHALLLWIDPTPALPNTLLSKYITLLDTAAELITRG